MVKTREVHRGKLADSFEIHMGPNSHFKYNPDLDSIGSKSSMGTSISKGYGDKHAINAMPPLSEDASELKRSMSVHFHKDMKQSRSPLNKSKQLSQKPQFQFLTAKKPGDMVPRY